MTGGTRKLSVNVTTITAQMILQIRNKSLYIFMKDLLITFFKQDNAYNKCYVLIKKIMPNLLFNKLFNIRRNMLGKVKVGGWGL